MAWDFENNRPIYIQLMEIIKKRVISGAIKPGEKLPSVRELAFKTGVNPNTMQRAMAELEREGLIFSVRTAGRYVTENEEEIAFERKNMAKTMIAEFLSSIESLGYTDDQIIDLIKEDMKGEKYDGNNGAI